MANDIACLAAEKKGKEFCQVLKNLNIYDNEAELVLLSAVGGVISDDYTVCDSETEDYPKKDTHISNSQHDMCDSGAQNVSKSNGLKCFDMDKSKDNNHDQVNIEIIGSDDFSDDDEDNG
eukprot:15338210-Ditylum_brightwellii.AAC.1